MFKYWNTYLVTGSSLGTEIWEESMYYSYYVNTNDGEDKIIRDMVLPLGWSENAHSSSSLE